MDGKAKAIFVRKESQPIRLFDAILYIIILFNSAILRCFVYGTQEFHKNLNIA